MSKPTGYAGRGSRLEYSTDNLNFTNVAQIQQFESTGSKQTRVDQTNLLTPGPFTQDIPVQIDSGDFDFAGVLNPQDATYLALLHHHYAMTLLYWRVVLMDGTKFFFQAYVSEFKPFSVKWNKVNGWTGKLRVNGVIEGPLTVFDPNAFDPSAFQIF